MKNRTCYVWVFITNDKGETNRYGARPLRGDELGQSVAAVRLTNFQKNPSPVYIVRLATDGQTSCDCPQHSRAGACKHADALLAAGLLPSVLVGALQAAEAESKRVAMLASEEKTAHELDAEGFAARIADLELEGERQARTVANLSASVSNLKEQNALLQTLLDEAQDFLLDMEKPRRRPAARKAA